MQSFYEKFNISKYIHDWLFKFFRLVVLRLVKKFLQYKVYHLLLYLRAYSTKLFSHLLWVCHINYIIENVNADSIFYDTFGYSDCYFFFLNLFFLFSEGVSRLLFIYFYKFLYIVFYQHYFCKVYLQKPIGKSNKLLIT